MSGNHEGPAGGKALVRRLLREHGIRPRKSLGQNFLAQRTFLRAIVAAADLAPEDVVLEIGPGLGILTAALCDTAGRVIAVEVDPAMMEVLHATVGRRPNIQLVAADILRVNPGELLAAGAGTSGRVSGYKVVANLPYYITSAVLRHILEARVKPELAVVMVQREVADRILARPGDMSLLSVAIQFFAHPSLIAVVPASAFHPQPNVDSAILRLDVHGQPPVDIEANAAGTFFRVVRAGFSHRRKQLKNSLAAGLPITPTAAVRALRAAGIDPRRRAQALTLSEWAALTHALGPVAGSGSS